MKPHKIEVPVWNTDVFIVVGGTREKFRKFLHDYGYSADRAASWADEQARCNETGSAMTCFDPECPWYVVVWLPELGGDCEFAAGVSHELLHATFRILHRKGLTLGADSEEAYTYLLEHLTLRFWTWATPLIEKGRR